MSLSEMGCLQSGHFKPTNRFMTESRVILVSPFSFIGAELLETLRLSTTLVVVFIFVMEEGFCFRCVLDSLLFMGSIDLGIGIISFCGIMD